MYIQCQDVYCIKAPKPKYLLTTAGEYSNMLFKRLNNLELLAGIAQLVEYKLPKLGVAGSIPVARSINQWV